jgi:hypothetical protein
VIVIAGSAAFGSVRQRSAAFGERNATGACSRLAAGGGVTPAHAQDQAMSLGRG